MSAPRIVIIGAGQGGLQAAISLRQNGFDGEITLAGAEPGLPYQRPPLSKAYLLDRRAEALTLRPASFYASKQINYLPGTRIKRIDRDRQVVQPETGQLLPYDHLILATGSSNVRPSAISGLKNAGDLRTMQDADALHACLMKARRIAVIGGGFIGLEFAAIARKLGHEVAVTEAGSRLMSRAVSSEISDIFAARHCEWGCELHFGNAVTEVTRGGVILSNGTCIGADLTLLAAGVRPNTELAEQAGLEIDNGIKTDRQLKTSDPLISALGDCASFPDPRSGRQIRLESVQAATDHARLIAARIAGNETADYSALPWFWSDQGDYKLQIAGLARPDDRAEAVSETIVARFDGAVLTAVETINDARTHMKVRKLLSSQSPVTRADFNAVIKA